MKEISQHDYNLPPPRTRAAATVSGHNATATSLDAAATDGIETVNFKGVRPQSIEGSRAAFGSAKCVKDPPLPEYQRSAQGYP